MILQIIKIKVIILYINLREAQEEVTCPMILNGDLRGHEVGFLIKYES